MNDNERKSASGAGKKIYEKPELVLLSNAKSAEGKSSYATVEDAVFTSTTGPS
ncbi:hypothetical protein [Sphingorhabdus sp. YGSMI21]|uniref:hypothetical protein n=1 Tax=Sphingorhabdus sp. YGSMI21 TaxID=2077182 RepID=UPI0013D984A1|nr:hypothetical protein [Sphingorhabdus sp. YGSMI21]